MFRVGSMMTMTTLMKLMMMTAVWIADFNIEKDDDERQYQY